MKRYILPITAMVVMTCCTSPMAKAAVILRYDSLLPGSGGSATELSRIDSETDNTFVASSDATSTVGARGVMASIHPSQSNVQGAFGNQRDLLYRFGNSNTTPGNGILGGALSPGHVALGPYLSFTYTAAQAQTLTDFSFQMWVNSNSGNNHAARDAGLYVQTNGGGFSQFGALYLTNGPNGPQGTVTFSDNLAVGLGDVVDIRLGFTDRTRTNNDLQATTRIGDVAISAAAIAAIPEPSTTALLGLGGLALILRRRKA